MEFVTAVIIVLVASLFSRWVTVIVGALAGAMVLGFVWALVIGFVLWGIFIAPDDQQN